MNKKVLSILLLSMQVSATPVKPYFLDDVAGGEIPIVYGGDVFAEMTVENDACGADLAMNQFLERKEKRAPIDFARKVKEEGTYVVQRGDSWYGIAMRIYGADRPVLRESMGVLGNAIARWNGKTIEDRLEPGDSLAMKDIEVRMVVHYDTFEGLAKGLGMSVKEFRDTYFWVPDELPAGSLFYVVNEKDLPEEKAHEKGTQLNPGGTFLIEG